MKGSCKVRWAAAGLAFLVCALPSVAQEANPEPVSTPQTAQQAAQPASAPAAAPLRVTLQDALDRGRKNSVQFQAALTTAGLARQDRTQARNALLPTVSYNNSVIYTKGVPLGTQTFIGAPVIFIANNAVHEYLSQADVHQVFDAAAVANFRRMGAAAAVAKAQAEIASRGLVVTIVQNYYAISATRLKLETAKRLAEEGDHFLKVTQELEQGGEVAHSDVIKAELQARDRRDRLEVDDVDRRVAERLGEDRLGVGLQRPPEILRIVGIDQRGVDAELGSEPVRARRRIQDGPQASADHDQVWNRNEDEAPVKILRRCIHEPLLCRPWASIWTNASPVSTRSGFRTRQLELGGRGVNRA